MSAPERMVSQRELAELVGLTTRQIRNLEGRGLPVRAEGNRKLYPVPDAVRWYVDAKAREAAEAAESTPYDEALARKTLADARIQERKLAELDGALVPMALHRQVLTRVAERVAARLRNLPGEWAPRIVGIGSPREAVPVLQSMANSILEDMAGGAEDMVRDPRQEEIPEDFPAAVQLRAAGVELLGELADMEDITELPGIGRSRSRAIRTELVRRGLAAPAPGDYPPARSSAR